MMKKIFLILFALLVFAVPIKMSAVTNQEQILSFSSDIAINSDASVNVKETIKYYFPTEKHGIYRHIPYRYLDKTNNKYFQTPVSIQSVTDENNNAYQYSRSEENGSVVLKIGDPNKTIFGEHIYLISYRVSGVINYFADHDEFYWNVTGDEWRVPINDVSTSVSLPEKVNKSSIMQKCFTGDSTDQNCKRNYNGTANYSADTGPLTIVLGWNKGVVAVTERDYEISLRYETAWFWLIPLLVLLFLLFLYFKNGRDPFGRGTIAPEFDAPEGLLPAEIGTLIDEKAENKDISATIVDLAVKGYLKIKNKKNKYSLIKVKEADSKLKTYEKELFNAFLGGKKETDLSEIHIDEEVKLVKQSLYQDLVGKKYFVKSPDKIRGRYLLVGFIAIFGGGFFAIFSWNFAFALGLAGLITMIFSKAMPKKTKEGVIAKEKSLGLKEFLYRADRYRLKWQEKEEIFEKFLPYAMVFGIVNQWAKNFKEIYKEPPDWYQGDFTAFNTVVFASSINSFSSSASSSYSPAAASGSSGFGGGGGGGGGFGGGGGGSW